MVARRHHYVPNCYLNSFAVENPVKKKSDLLVFDVTDRKEVDIAMLRDGIRHARSAWRVSLTAEPPRHFENSFPSAYRADFRRATNSRPFKQLRQNCFFPSRPQRGPLGRRTYFFVWVVASRLRDLLGALLLFRMLRERGATLKGGRALASGGYRVKAHLRGGFPSSCRHQRCDLV